MQCVSCGRSAFFFQGSKAKVLFPWDHIGSLGLSSGGKERRARHREREREEAEREERRACSVMLPRQSRRRHASLPSCHAFPLHASASCLFPHPPHPPVPTAAAAAQANTKPIFHRQVNFTNSKAITANAVCPIAPKFPLPGPFQLPPLLSMSGHSPPFRRLAFSVIFHHGIIFQSSEECFCMRGYVYDGCMSWKGEWLRGEEKERDREREKRMRHDTEFSSTEHLPRRCTASLPG